MTREAVRFVIGLGAGIGVGLLLAPRSGEKTRSILQGKATDGAAYLREQGERVRDAAAEAVRDSTQKVTTATEAVRAAVDAGKLAYTESIKS